MTTARKTRRKVRKFTLEQQQRIVEESFAAGASVRDVALRHDVRPTLLSTWRQQAARGTQRMGKHPRFAAVRVAAMAAAVDGVIEIDLDQRAVRVRGVVDGAMLREVLAAAR